MAGGGDSGQARLAELVAALSLGIDLGFGQPMEHVLRQCLIALRLAERIGLDEHDARRRLLHGPARQRRLPHRRARAGQVVRRRHRAEVGQVRPRPAELAGSRGRCAVLGRGHPPLHRFRVGLEFALSGHRDVDGMIAPACRARAARSPQQLGLPDAVLEALGRGLRAMGRARLAGRARGRRDPARGAASRSSPSSSRSRTASAASTARAALARERGGKQFDPALGA